MDLKEYRDQQIAALERTCAEELEKLRNQLRGETAEHFQRLADEAREECAKRNREAIRRFNAGLARIEQDRQKATHQFLLAFSEQALKESFDSVIAFNQGLLHRLLINLSKLAQQ